MARNNNIDVAEFVKRIARNLEKPPTPLEESVFQRQALREPTYPETNIGSQSRGVVGTAGEGNLTAGP